MTKNASNDIRDLVEKALDVMSSRGITFSRENFNRAVEGLSGFSVDDKNLVKAGASEAFDAGTWMHFGWSIRTTLLS